MYELNHLIRGSVWQSESDSCGNHLEGSLSPYASSKLDVDIYTSL